MPSNETRRTPGGRVHSDSYAHKAAYLERSIQNISPGNRDQVRRFLDLKRGQLASVNTLVRYLSALRHFDSALGKPWRDVTPDDATAFLGRMRLAGYAHATISGDVAYIKAFLKWVLDAPALSPRLLFAFRIMGNRQLPQRPVLSLDEESRVMQAMTCLRDQAIFGVLIESGFRLGELLALDVGSLEFDDQNGCWITIPAGAPHLKTGPRSVYLGKYARLVAAYLSTHPERDDTSAPLWLRLDNQRRPLAGHRFGRNGVDQLMRRAKAVAGVRHFRIHDLRHTAATRFSEAGANAKDFQERFGWSEGSSMPSHYAHHSRQHQEDIARRAAGVDALGFAATPAQGSGMKACPLCAEEIREAAIKCRFCGTLLEVRGQSR